MVLDKDGALEARCGKDEFWDGRDVAGKGALMSGGLNAD